MIKCDEKTLIHYLKQYGWSHKKDNQGKLRTGWVSDNHSFKLNFSINENFISFEVSLLKIWEQIHHNEWFMIFKRLLKINADAKMVKIALNEKKEIVLKAEIMNIHFSFEHLSHIIGIVTYYAENCLEIIKDSLCFYQSQSINRLHC